MFSCPLKGLIGVLFNLQVYQEMFKEEREKYEKDMRVWEAEMVKENKLHLVRKMYLPKPYKPEPVSIFDC